MSEQFEGEVANSWQATASDIIRRIRTRWGNPPLTKFAKMAGVNYRTLVRLVSSEPNSSMSIETVLRMFSNLRVSAWTMFNTTEDVNKENSLLNQALSDIVICAFPPKAELAKLAIHEMEHQQGCGIPVK